MRIIAHLDMDAFFAAIEERDNPRFKGLPIVVGADPKGGRGRGIVSTANYKAREYGIHSAQPISTAWRLSEKAARQGKPRAVFLPPNFDKYLKVSREIMAIIHNYSPVVEEASIDEAYIEFPISNFSHFARSGEAGQFPKDSWQEAIKIAKNIKNEIWLSQKLTCSIGIGPNKLTAKIASDYQKPDGLTVVKKEEAEKFLEPLPIIKLQILTSFLAGLKFSVKTSSAAFPKAAFAALRQSPSPSAFPTFKPKLAPIPPCAGEQFPNLPL